MWKKFFGALFLVFAFTGMAFANANYEQRSMYPKTTTGVWSNWGVNYQCRLENMSAWKGIDNPASHSVALVWDKGNYTFEINMGDTHFAPMSYTTLPAVIYINDDQVGKAFLFSNSLGRTPIVVLQNFDFAGAKTMKIQFPDMTPEKWTFNVSTDGLANEYKHFTSCIKRNTRIIRKG